MTPGVSHSAAEVSVQACERQIIECLWIAINQAALNVDLVDLFVVDLIMVVAAQAGRGPAGECASVVLACCKIRTIRNPGVSVRVCIAWCQFSPHAKIFHC